MHGHFITICKSCNKVISQCRCTKPDKVTKYSLCDECHIEQLKEQRGGCRNCDD